MSMFGSQSGNAMVASAAQFGGQTAIGTTLAGAGAGIYGTFDSGAFDPLWDWMFAEGKVADVVQDHHAIPWNHKTFNHQAHPLVKQAEANLKSLSTNIKPLKGHIGRHSSSYHQELRRRMDEGYKKVGGQGKDAAEAELDSIIKGIWDDIRSGDLKPYDHKGVLLPE